MKTDSNIYKAGLLRLNICLKNKSDVENALHRDDIGYINLIYGKPGNGLKQFKGGFGLSHIIAKRDYEKAGEGIKTAKKIIEVVLFGRITKTIKSKETIHIQKDGYEAVLSLNWHGNKVNWILTGYKIK